MRSAWQVAIDAAGANNHPGTSSSFVTFDWSGGCEGEGNLHRNVIFHDAHVPDAPISYIDVIREDDLWAWMEENETKGMKAWASSRRRTYRGRSRSGPWTSPIWYTP